MVRVIGPCMSGEAHGKFGNILVYKKRLSTNVVSRYFVPHNPRSPAQTINRNRTDKAVEGWQALSDENQAVWNTYAKQFARKGYNMYVSAFRNYMRDHAEAEPGAPFFP